MDKPLQSVAETTAVVDGHLKVALDHMPARVGHCQPHSGSPSRPGVAEEPPAPWRAFGSGDTFSIDGSAERPQ